MKVMYEKENKLLNIEIEEEIDHHNAEKIRTRADYEIQKNMPKTVIIDFKNVIFMDSAGIGMVIGRYKLANMLGAELKIKNINNKTKKVFEMSGILKIVSIENENIIGGNNNEKCI